MTDQLSENTDREIWRKVEGDFYSPSIHVTKDGAIGINVGGTVIVMPVDSWHALAEWKPFRTDNGCYDLISPKLYSNGMSDEDVRLGRTEPQEQHLNMFSAAQSVVDRLESGDQLQEASLVDQLLAQSSSRFCESSEYSRRLMRRAAEALKEQKSV